MYGVNSDTSQLLNNRSVGPGGAITYPRTFRFHRFDVWRQLPLRRRGSHILGQLKQRSLCPRIDNLACQPAKARSLFSQKLWLGFGHHRCTPFR
jgi:hypothetical protein